MNTPTATGSKRKRPNECRPSTSREPPGVSCKQVTPPSTSISNVEEASASTTLRPESASGISPPKKRLRRALSDTEKLMAYNVYKYVYNKTYEEEKLDAVLPDIDPIKINKTEIASKTAEILGISQTSVYRVLKEHKENACFSPPSKTGPKLTFRDKIDEFTFNAIRRKVHIFFFDKELPTVEKVLQKVNEDPDLPNFSLTTMRRILKYLNFKYMSRTRRSILIERQDIIAWRRKYLLQIRQLRREKRPIYYQDETWLNEGHTTSKTLVDLSIESPRQAFLQGLSTGLKAPTGKGRRLIISHIGNEDGFVEGGLKNFVSKTGKEDYHQDMNHECFQEWFAGILPKLKPNAVIVLDNAPYHSKKVDLFPNMSWTKPKIIEWMQRKEIDFPPNSTKSDMIEIAKPFKHLYQKCIVDKMAEDQGMTVLRLPPYHCELNPIELIWAQAKGYVARHNKNFKMEEVQNLFDEALQLITAARWTSCIDHVKKTEEKMMELDHLVDTVTDSFIIHVSDDDDDDDIDDDCSITDDSE